METTLRPITEADLPFLYQVYASTRTEELVLVDWTDEHKTAFLMMQFQAQHTYYQQHYPQASFDIIEAQGQPIGRLYVDRWPTETRIIDIALLPAYRRSGIGSYYLRKLIAEAEGRGVGVSIHVERTNPALRLYHRLGFRQVGDQGVYLLLKREPKSVALRKA